jgi:hypothetical protein
MLSRLPLTAMVAPHCGMRHWWQSEGASHTAPPKAHGENNFWSVFVWPPLQTVLFMELDEPKISFSLCITEN